MIHPKEMPYAMGVPYRDREPIVYDGGDFPGAMEKVLQAIGGLPAFRDRQREARRSGRYLGLGVASYVEGTGVGPFESAIVRIEPTGSIYVTSGACAQGQGMETIFAQVVADTWSVDPRDVVISLGDTALIAIGFGTIASRSTVTLSGAIHYGCRPDWGAMNYLVQEGVEREEAGETEGAILKYIRTADDRRVAEDSMREMHRLLGAYATGLAREYLAAP
jgi:CO/xanthine dehydrogenase Mo-binding subunit